MGDDRPTVLVVDDQKDVADLFTAMLQSTYDVRTAYGGEEALEKADEDVDVVLLDRKMPGMSGDDVLDALRERGLDVRVAMVTAVLPDFDILEMGFDDYVVKPVKKADLVETVEKLLKRSGYGDRVQQYFSLLSKRAALQSEKTESELRQNEEYLGLEERVEEMRTSLEDALSDIVESEGYGEAFRQL